jgi:N-acetylglucosaminyldiphosphoundecaprenol N-acetyl-beta-D-mannosaminyltransferase
MSSIPMTTVELPLELAEPAFDAAAAHVHARVDGAAPRKADVFGVGVSMVDPHQALDQIMKWARQRRPAIVDFMGVHGLTLAQSDETFKQRLNQFDMVCCDGQPVRWALNRWHKAGIGERVYGPAMTIASCRTAAEQGVSVYFYGSRTEVLDRLTERIGEQFPALRIVGAEAPPFRPLTEAESRATVARINGSGAGIVFIGLGCPKQEVFAADHRSGIHAVQLCVGAAFDLHAGLAPMAPIWMQNAGLEWLYRLCREPRRLWKRYLVGNTQFLRMCLVKSVFGDR